MYKPLVVFPVLEIGQIISMSLILSEMEKLPIGWEHTSNGSSKVLTRVYREHIMVGAAERYAHQWGSDKIITA